VGGRCEGKRTLACSTPAWRQRAHEQVYRTSACMRALALTHTSAQLPASAQPRGGSSCVCASHSVFWSIRLVALVCLWLFLPAPFHLGVKRREPGHRYGRRFAPFCSCEPFRVPCIRSSHVVLCDLFLSCFVHPKVLWTRFSQCHPLSLPSRSSSLCFPCGSLGFS
jgi:hypothetical protein